ncbi:MAG: hypothetical protein R3C42_05300 [Parvularculaceae bacterium]|nr:hypothetical protein [Parvularculaceae bacterium]
MVRILLPLAIIATLLFAPIFGAEPTEVGGITKTNTVTGMDYVGDTINCWMGGEYSVSGDCAPQGGTKGLAVFAAAFVSAVAAALGFIGLLPVVGRITSAITMLAGVIVIAGIGFYILTSLGSDEGIGGIQWGAYLAGGGGLLTMISGLSGMRGR